MARGAQKIQSQERNAKKRAAAAKANAAPISQAQLTADKTQCEICKTFVKKPAKGNYVMVTQHAEAKHPKNTVEQCFPCIVAMKEADKKAAGKAAKAAKKEAASAAKAKKEKKDKKKKKEDLSFLDDALGGKKSKKKSSKKK
mmetsp:Transcript_53320/g.79234  ORF Transcript_53320/g.79234 Transcript_53320/m.79234 type:complete len:142 (-) Transcript_53320:77-502(-)|eukprot:CAMPEP_0195519628 /NCGR_PEP_ID=MMETSP0794_2-20130614/15166_1 /TAXON_ID=515487 /ORGANISM="Stephanopyxis turris, Strain CCMP 815" /LENGTH=141 /DNA_ID=CAMNT_0040648815 /DNA_START=8 /DNA_END=433 /DNA_ORIENTATION=-